jgi:hypothetical protein
VRDTLPRVAKRASGARTSWSRLVDIRNGELRITLASFLELFGGVAAQTMLETGSHDAGRFALAGAAGPGGSERLMALIADSEGGGSL